MTATYKVSLTASETETAAFAALMTETLDPPPAVDISAGGAERLLEAYFPDRPDMAALAALLSAAGGGTAAPALHLAEVPDENWVARVQRGLHPVRAGRFLIHGSHDRLQVRSKRYAIEIDAGQAFGTAHHGTTRGCLLAIERLAKRSAWRTALDVGTGTGILAIATAKIARARIIATDIDPVAVAVAEMNFRLNGVAGRIQAYAAPGTRHARIAQAAPFDLITANILAGPLIALAPGLARLTAPAGAIVLSGLLDDQAREVGAAYLRLGLKLGGRLSLEGWTTLILRRMPI